ncbi:uncharacterized protein PRCAT00004777001 [Priceomyces carsonii]|uniref:uncharacterized protein n=1 Tax=Priceomyces carsonii TaxID=28549 RepID=UPI002ED90216|nr:unnamed protein product [Priceomyces carsonii]
MFAPRFDPSRVLDDQGDNLILSRAQKLGKRRLSLTSFDDQEKLISELSEDDTENSHESSLEHSIDGSSDESSDVSSDEENDGIVDVENEMAIEHIDDNEEIETTEVEASTLRMSRNKESDMEIDEASDSQYKSKHKALFLKFRSLVKRESDSENETPEDFEKQDLAPLPQPPLPRDKKLVSTLAYSNNLNWLATPKYSSPSDKKPFKDIPLSSVLLRNLEKMGFGEAFSVQISVLDIILKDIEKNKLRPDFMGDILVNASTGSGKTLAYLIPIVEALYRRIVPRIRAIILVPTRPLINQVKATILELSKGTNLSVASLKNDISIKEEGEKITSSEPDILVSTPGRLVDHLNNNTVSLRNLRFLVIDEADRLLNQSFQNWCQVLNSKLPKPSDISHSWESTVQKLVFSATLTTDAGKLALLNFQKPRLIIVNDNESLVNELFTVPRLLEELKLRFGSAKSPIKPLILAKFLIQNNKLENVLVFAKSNESTMRLARLLNILLSRLQPEKTINVTYMNSTNNKSSSRTKILKDFANQSINILVATDLIARGIDVLSITDVVNYDLPNSSREYVHRVGRTARANRNGFAYNLCFGKGEDKWFVKLMSNIGRANKEVLDQPVDFKDLVSSQDVKIYEECLELLKDETLKSI